MAERVGSGPVIAVDLYPEIEHAPADPFDVSLSGWRVLRATRPPAGRVQSC